MLFRSGLLATPTAAQALGYSEIVRFLNGDIAGREELTERLVMLTARYAKRQRTWFRHQHPNAIQIAVTPDDTARTLAARVMQQL